MNLYKLITIKLDLTNKEKNQVNQMLGCKRLIWNITLAYKKELWDTYKRRNPCINNEKEKKIIQELGSNFTIQKALTMKNIINYPEFEFLKMIPNRCKQQALNDLDLAFNNFFKKNKSYPRFKNKKDTEQSIRFLDCLKITQLNKNNIEIRSGKIFKFKGKNPLKNTNKKINEISKDIISVTIKKDSIENYFAIICIKHRPTIKQKENESIIGLDVGITDCVSTSNNENFKLPTNIRSITNKRIKKQKIISKKIKGSRSYKKIMKSIKKCYKKESNIRKDFHHKLSNNLTKNHSHIIVENLKINNMSKSAKGTINHPGKNVSQKKGLNRAILEQGWGQLFKNLEYKSEWNGSILTKVAAQGTSITCSLCSDQNHSSRKGKIFKCVKCGHKIDADINAAKNIKTRGQRGLAKRD